MKPATLKYKTTVKVFKPLQKGVIKKVSTASFKTIKPIDPVDIEQIFGSPGHKLMIKYQKIC